MFDEVNETFAERLTSLLRTSPFRLTPGLLCKLSGLPKATLVNWLEGRVSRPRRWQDIVKVANALRLHEDEASSLLMGAGHPPIRRLAVVANLSDDLELLAPWAKELSGYDDARRRLPNPGTLIGREDIAAQIASSLTNGNNRLVSVTGMPGVGKTHLAVSVARSLEPQFDCTPVWIPLGTLSGTTPIVGAVATSLGQTARNEATLRQFLSREFARRSILFVIDNAEHLVDAAAGILALLESAAGISVLLTSRSALRCAGEREIRVSPLAVPTLAEIINPPALRRNVGVRVFCVHAEGLDPQCASDEAMGAIGTVVRLLEGIPLSLSLAAAQLSLFTPAALAKNLAQRFPMLANARLSVDGRRQSLRSAIDWSFEILSTEQRRLFRQCALYECGWTLASSAAILYPADEDTMSHNLQTLTELVEHGLIFAKPDVDGEPRFFMLDTMREYALERLHEAKDRGVTERSFVRYYSQMIGDASRACAADTRAWPSKLFAIEAPNIRAALGLAISGGDSTAALTMATAWSIWETQSDTERAAKLTQKALHMPSDPDDEEVVRLRARALRTLGILAIEHSALDEAGNALRSALDLMSRANDQRGLAIAQCDVAFLCYRLGNAEGCRKYASSALKYFECAAPAPHRELGWANFYLALADLEDGANTSMRPCEVAMFHALAAADKRLSASVHQVAGLLAVRSGNLAKAEQYFCASIGDCNYEENAVAFNSLAGLGIVAARNGRPQRAIALFAAADRGLAAVRDFGMTLSHLSQAVAAARESIAKASPVNVLELWSRAGTSFDLRSAMSYVSVDL